MCFELPIHRTQSKRELQPRKPRIQPTQQVHKTLDRGGETVVSRAPRGEVPDPTTDEVVPVNSKTFYIHFFRAGYATRGATGAEVSLTSNTGPSTDILVPPDIRDVVFDTITEVVTAARNHAPREGTSAPTCFVEFFDATTVDEVVGGRNDAAPDMTVDTPKEPPYSRPVGITVLVTDKPKISSRATAGLEGSTSIDRL